MKKKKLFRNNKDALQIDEMGDQDNTIEDESSENSSN